MATTISAGATAISPILVEGYEASSPGGARVHQIIGRTNPDVTLRPAGMRTGTLSLLFDKESDALAAYTALSAPVVAVLTSDERTIGMSFVVPEGQSLGYALDSDTRAHWHVSVPYQEVSP